MASVDPTISTASIAALEAMVNAALNYDPGSRLALEKLSGQVLAIEATVPPFELYIAPSQDGVKLMGSYEGEVTTRLRGPLPALLQLAVGADTASLADSGVEVVGSTSMLTHVQRIAHNLEIDWEEALAQLFGDVLGHQMAEHLRLRVRWLGNRFSSAQRLLGEYLTEELRSLPAKPELTSFSREVDELRLGADRIEARIQQLQQALERRRADKPDQG